MKNAVHIFSAFAFAAFVFAAVSCDEAASMQILNNFKPVTLQYELNGGSWTGNFEPKTSCSLNEMVSLPVQGNLQKSGCKFIGWYADSGCAGKRLYSYRADGNATLYAKWIAASEVNDSDSAQNTGASGNPLHRVEYELNGGYWSSGYKPAEYFMSGKIALLPEEQPIRERYLFCGWFADKDISGIPLEYISADTKQDITLYAEWKLDGRYIGKISDLADVLAGIEQDVHTTIVIYDTDAVKFEWEILETVNTTIDGNLTDKTTYTLDFSLCTNMTHFESSNCYNCRHMTSCILPKNLIQLDSSNFVYCRNMQSITVPKTLQTIADGNFNSCDKLATVYYEGSQEDWNNLKNKNNAHSQNNNKKFWNAEIIYNYKY
ncbi:MAG: InlB B-repeat-containing protein [Bacteroides sp.]|nr:InlB B-repeat-containing protein [Prevotella sp.]MCM1407916.1 InlB B-repeat-containing protein [Treponema brennaborense]MCM1469658.1 InlB B-repeat-containing protein [Bacteroides sp.]